MEQTAYTSKHDEQIQSTTGTHEKKKTLRNLRWEGVVLCAAANSLAFVALVRLIIKVQLVEAIGKGQKHKEVDEKELEDVQEHST